ncbi:MAG: tRNA (adenosine(37)-N6)-threonylcarbamoyltransferase complex ATPase subunit type 1 TsaE [Desulfobacterales bacterium]|nr:tRNA (adenosine(37)-N6)-threonylcarbamoyltransferase complex ATPase subunit type 1 TsaE [Desulfobacterales bacterium]
MFILKANSLEETDKIAEKIAEAFKNSGGLICLYGDIGVSKTTLVKSIAKYLDIKEKVTSPSFVILNEYHSGKLSLYHFDLYRLEDEGIKSILDELREHTENDKALTVIEWAEFSSGDLPEDRLEITIKYIDDTQREFNFKSFGQKSGLIFDKIKTL